MSAVLDHHDHAHDDHGHAPAGWRRWVFATNHKDIGTLYLLFSFVMLMIGGVLALLIRAELFQPGLQIVNPELFNQFTTMHGLIMVFGAIMPAFVGFANWMLPLQIGASDMAFARMNNFSFWLMIPAGLMLAGSFFMPGGAPAAGWTLYAPLTLQMGPSMDAGIFALHILGASVRRQDVATCQDCCDLDTRAQPTRPARAQSCRPGPWSRVLRAGMDVQLGVQPGV